MYLVLKVKKLKEPTISYLSEAAELVLKACGLLAITGLLIKTLFELNSLLYLIVIFFASLALFLLAIVLMICAVVRIETAFTNERRLPAWAESMIGLAASVVLTVTLHSLFLQALP